VIRRMVGDVGYALRVRALMAVDTLAHVLYARRLITRRVLQWIRERRVTR
jgi:hypothetical protein